MGLGETKRCAEVRASWRSGAVLNRQEKREKAGAIEGEKEGARYARRELGNELRVFFQGLLF